MSLPSIDAFTSGYFFSACTAAFTKNDMKPSFTPCSFSNLSLYLLRRSITGAMFTSLNVVRMALVCCDSSRRSAIRARRRDIGTRCSGRSFSHVSTEAGAFTSGSDGFAAFGAAAGAAAGAALAAARGGTAVSRRGRHFEHDLVGLDFNEDFVLRDSLAGLFLPLQHRGFRDGLGELGNLDFNNSHCDFFLSILVTTNRLRTVYASLKTRQTR